MPVQSWGHSQYWAGGDGPPPTGAPVSVGGYPGWQTAARTQTVTGSAFGPLQWLWERATGAVWWWWRWLDIGWRARRWGTDRQWILVDVINTIEHPMFPYAIEGVVKTAKTPGFARPEAWARLSHKLKERGTWAENAWRHMNACDVMAERIAREGDGTFPVSNPNMNLMVELAYRRLWRM